MKRIIPAILLSCLLVIAFKYQKRLFPPPPPANPQIIDSLRYYHGTSYVSIVENQYDISLLNQELSSPHQVTMTPDNKYILVSQQTGEIFAFSKLGGSNFNSQPNLVTLLNSQSAPLITFSQNYSQDHVAHLTDGNQVWATTLTETNYRLYGSTPLKTTLIPTDLAPSPQSKYHINPQTQEVLLDNTPIVHRHKDAVGKIGSLKSITLDPTTNHFFFTDSDEGRLYEGKLKIQ